MAKTPQVGEQAPDFELDGTDGPFKLSDHRGERVVLLFYPGDNTMVCTKQFCSYRDRAQEFTALNATVVGISAQDLDSHRGFVDKHGLTVPSASRIDWRHRGEDGGRRGCARRSGNVALGDASGVADAATTISNDPVSAPPHIIAWARYSDTCHLGSA
jgi:AhpC/TSA family